jgi:ABC-2 type transport system ATP-binding protein
VIERWSRHTFEALVALPLVALGLLALAPTHPPRVPFAAIAAVPAGVAAGTLLFVVLARQVPTVRRRSAAAVGTGFAVAATGASEEAIWRGFLLARLVPCVGIVAAVLLAAGGFAATHFPAMGRVGVVVHLGTGVTFGTLFALTGSLAACAAAHVMYNVLVILGREPRLTGPIATAVAVEAAPALCLESIVKRFGSVVALDGFSMTVAAGEVVALLGPNGAGKTTAVNIVLGLRRPDVGVATIFGRDPRDWKARLLVGATPQEMSFPPTLRVRELVAFTRAHYPEPVETEALLAQFGLADLAGRQVGGLSGGQRRRLAVAVAFAGGARLVVLDEPTTGLDIESRRAVWDALREYARRGGAVLLTTHYLDEAEALADRIVFVSRGIDVARGTPAELLSDGGTLEEAYLRLTGGEA